MADYTFSTTPEQEALLSWIVQMGNAQKDTAYTNEQYVQLRFPELLVPYAEAYKKSLHQQLVTKFDAADPLTQADIKTKLGVS